MISTDLLEINNYFFSLPELMFKGFLLVFFLLFLYWIFKKL